MNIYVAKPPAPSTSTGSYVGIETNDPNKTGSIQLRATTVGITVPTAGETYTASDILQTLPSTITDPTYLASAGIQIGPGVDLVTKTAGQAPFSTYIYPTTLYYGLLGTIGGRKAGYVWLGSVLFSGSYPDTTTPVARYRVQQPLICSGITVSCNVAAGGSDTLVVTVCKNASTGASLSGATSITVTLGSAVTFASYYNTSVNFAAGDLLSVYLSSGGNNLSDVSIQVDCF